MRGRRPRSRQEGHCVIYLRAVEIQLKSRVVNGVAVVDVAGELDIATSPRLKSAVHHALTEGCSRVVVNLLQTTYLDSTALSVLTSAQKEARRAGGNVGLVYGQPQIEKILTMTGLKDSFQVFRTEEDAVNAAKAHGDTRRPR